jgi:AcrR family transcriptional regulator
MTAQPPRASTPALPNAAPRATRQRLPAEVRSAQILDAALQAFSEHGYAATRIDDIAAVAGLSKGGIYTHFKSKDEIFEALLERSLTPNDVEQAALQVDTPVTVDVLIARLVEPLYESLLDGDTMRTLRLLLSDGMHIPERVARWRTTMIEPYRVSVEQLVRRGVAQGTLRNGAVAQAPWLLMSPGVQLMLECLIEGEPAPEQLAQKKQAHIAMLRELLKV